jgi:ergothioneine biosynthesis protein EgtB
MQAPALAEAGVLLETGALARTYQRVRAFTLALVQSLTEEDCCAQSMPDASPAKWHLAHTTWFFEKFVLAQARSDYEPVYPDYLFNSYYDAVGPRHCRARRGLLTRPGLAEVKRYRATIDDQVLALLGRPGRDLSPQLLAVILLGCHHEQQHQELLLTDIKHLFSENPLRPAYREGAITESGHRAAIGPLTFLGFDAQLGSVGHGGDGFAFDNEGPRHRVFLESFSIASRLVTNGEYAAFIADGGYDRPELWLSDGYKAAQAEALRAPLYWDAEGAGGRRRVLTLRGMRPLDPDEPVCHVSYYEADAYARWAGARLATEAEWEIASHRAELDGNFVESDRLQPAPPSDLHPGGIHQMFGDVWEWTSSAYGPYPGFRPITGALGEYNGKFMCNQMVLRGGSCVTSASHIRSSYRNFFPPDARWQFAGIRLARS